MKTTNNNLLNSIKGYADVNTKSFSVLADENLTETIATSKINKAKAEVAMFKNMEEKSAFISLLALYQGQKLRFSAKSIEGVGIITLGNSSVVAFLNTMRDKTVDTTNKIRLGRIFINKILKKYRKTNKLEEIKGGKEIYNELYSTAYNFGNTMTTQVVIRESFQEVVLNRILNADLSSVNNLIAIATDIGYFFRMYQELSIDAAKKQCMFEQSFSISECMPLSRYKVALEKFNFKNSDLKIGHVCRKVDVSTLSAIGDIATNESDDVKADKAHYVFMDHIGAVQVPAINALASLYKKVVEETKELTLPLHVLNDITSVKTNVLKDIITYCNDNINYYSNVKKEKLDAMSECQDFISSDIMEELVKNINSEYRLGLENCSAIINKIMADNNISGYEAGRLLFAASNTDYNGNISSKGHNGTISSIMPETVLQYLLTISGTTNCRSKLTLNIDKKDALELVGTTVTFTTGIANNNSFYIEGSLLTGEMTIVEEDGKFYAEKAIEYPSVKRNCNSFIIPRINFLEVKEVMNNGRMSKNDFISYKEFKTLYANIMASAEKIIFANKFMNYKNVVLAVIQGRKYPVATFPCYSDLSAKTVLGLAVEPSNINFNSRNLDGFITNICTIIDINSCAKDEEYVEYDSFYDADAYLQGLSSCEEDVLTVGAGSVEPVVLDDSEDDAFANSNIPDETEEVDDRITSFNVQDMINMSCTKNAFEEDEEELWDNL